MAFFLTWIKLLLLLGHCVRSENIESNEPKSDDSVSFGYSTNPHSQRTLESSITLNNNGYNNHQTSFSHAFLHQSSDASTVSSSQSDIKDQKTLILAIPVKLALQKEKQENDESVVKSTHVTQSNINNPYNTGTYATHPHQPLANSPTHASQQQSQHQSSAPLSQKIYSSVNSAPYSTAQQSFNNHDSNPSYSNGEQYKTAFNLNQKFHSNRSSQDKYGKNDNYRSNQWNEGDEYKADTNGGVHDYSGNKYKNTLNGHIKYHHSNNDKLSDALKESTKSSYDTDSKLEYDYDTDSDIHKFDQYDNTKAIDSYRTKDNSYKTGDNQYYPKTSTFQSNPNHNYYPGNGQSYSSANNQDSDDEWAVDNYDTIKPNENNWPKIYDTIDSNDFPSLRGHRVSNKESGSNAYYTPVSDLFSDPLAKAASAPLAFKSSSSKIYGLSSSHQPSYGSSPSRRPSYEPLSLFAGFGRDYGRVNINGNLYPAPLVSNHPPRKLYKPKNYEGNKHENFDLAEFLSPHSVKLPPRNSFLMRPNYIPGLNGHRPLRNYTPFGSASSLSPYASSPYASSPYASSPYTSSYTINKSFGPHIFPALYG